jgi:hypothetical protein
MPAAIQSALAPAILRPSVVTELLRGCFICQFYKKIPSPACGLRRGPIVPYVPSKPSQSATVKDEDKQGEDNNGSIRHMHFQIVTEDKYKERKPEKQEKNAIIECRT